jgi:DNA polymerase-3 subunit epsilon
MPLAFVDIETTGSHLRCDRIIEIGILRVEEDKLVRTYKQLINPETYLSPFIEQITGINAHDLEDKPTFEQVKEEIMEILDGATFVAHNVRFDYGFVKNELKRYGISYSAKQLCTVRLSRTLFPEFHHHNLDALIKRFNFEIENRHRAFDDAHVLWKFYQALPHIFPQEKIEKTIFSLMKKPSVPINLDETMLEILPEGPGVYLFYGDGDVPLYIGKSINIKERVLAHFGSDHESSKELSITQQIKRIETIETVGELGALLKEASLIKKHQPIYNRQLRKTKKIVFLRKNTTPKGYDTIEIGETKKISADDIKEFLGIFTSKKKAKDYLRRQAEEHQLCEKLLGLEKGSGPCFGSKIGRCKGACLGHEKPISYNIRFIEAFSSRKIKSWPYKGPIRITEYDSIENRQEEFMINEWCLIGQIDDEKIFDYDTYKILVRYIFKQHNQKNIINLTDEPMDIDSYEISSISEMNRSL